MDDDPLSRRLPRRGTLPAAAEWGGDVHEAVGGRPVLQRTADAPDGDRPPPQGRLQRPRPGDGADLRRRRLHRRRAQPARPAPPRRRPGHRPPHQPGQGVRGQDRPGGGHRRHPLHPGRRPRVRPPRPAGADRADPRRRLRGGLRQPLPGQRGRPLLHPPGGQPAAQPDGQRGLQPLPVGRLHRLQGVHPPGVPGPEADRQDLHRRDGADRPLPAQGAGHLRGADLVPGPHLRRGQEDPLQGRVPGRRGGGPLPLSPPTAPPTSRG